jgi:ABC-type lipoprotein export system ATPase subunit
VNREGTTIMVATHSNEVAGYARKVFNIVDGRLQTL